MTLNLQELVLVVVDMQNGFLGPRSRHVLPHVLRLVREMKERDVPVVFTRFHNESGSQYERLIGWTRLRSSPEVDLSPELSEYATEIVDKNVYTAFTPAFTSMLGARGWRTVVVCGVATDGCVLKTAVDAFERGLTPMVVSDACASHAGEEVHAAGLLLLKRFIGKKQLVTMDEFLVAVDEARKQHP